MDAGYIITFSDVMAGIITCMVGVIGFLLRSYFKNILAKNEETNALIKENDKKVNERINKLETETDASIENIKKQISDIKGDFSTSFVLREDFFRSMNSVEDRIKGMDGKLDRLLMQKE